MLLKNIIVYSLLKLKKLGTGNALDEVHFENLCVTHSGIRHCRETL